MSVLGMGTLLTISNTLTGGRLRPEITKAWRGSLTSDTLPGAQYSEPKGDPGIYGPGSMMWRMHGDPAGVAGGVMGLILGSLHEPTMHGTNQHSVFRDDPAGRLGRTVSFVNAMTYGSTPVVERMVTMVRRMHKRVQGTMPDGRRYSATENEGIVWTGVTQAYGIVQANQRYYPDRLSPAEVDQYFAEYAVISERLGATEVPKSAQEVEDYFAEMRPRLTYSEETAGVVAFFSNPFGGTAISKVASKAIFQASWDLLPTWAKRLYRIEFSRREQLLIRASANALFDTVRFAVGEPEIRVEARKRAAAPTSDPAEKLATAKG